MGLRERRYVSEGEGVITKCVRILENGCSMETGAARIFKESDGKYTVIDGTGLRIGRYMSPAAAARRWHEENVEEMGEETYTYTIQEGRRKSLLIDRFSMENRRVFVQKFRRGMNGLMAAMDYIDDLAKKEGLPAEDMLALDDYKEIRAFISKFEKKLYYKSRV